MRANSFTVIQCFGDEKIRLKIREKIIVMNPERIHRLSSDSFHIRIYPHDRDITLFIGTDWLPVRFPNHCMYIDVLSKHRIAQQISEEFVVFRRLKIWESLTRSRI